MTRKQPQKLKILLLDIETAPIESYHWRLWKENIGLKQIKVDWSILSFSAKWLDSKVKPVYYDSYDERDIRNDQPLLLKLWDLLEEADVVIAHNGREFDLKKIRARMLIQGLPPFSPVRVIDTLEASKKHFGFTSNKLAYLSVLGGEEKYASKKFPGFDLWSEFLKRNPAARAEMKKYNIIDITSLEAYYLKIRPWIEQHPDVNIPTDSHEISCPKCGSLNMRSNGTRYTQTGAYPRYRCNDCGGSSWNKSSLLSLHKRKNILGN
jgi:predicted RNA-binding Zn-ribbon protein involved in translation (DUF1610 family)/DNA polymerase elongation subunit (family B)